MESRAKILGHPAHPMLIVFPLGLLVMSCVFDALDLVNPRDEWATVSYWMLVTGLAGGVVAAVPGWIDWSAIPSGTRAKSIGLYHGLGNVVMLGVFGASWFLRRENYTQPPALAQYLSFGAIALGTVTAWLGGELVDRLGVGVDRGANLNAPHSLSGKPADAPRVG